MDDKIHLKQQTKNAREGQVKSGRARQLKDEKDRLDTALYQIAAFNFSTTNLLIAGGSTKKDIEHLVQADLIEKECFQYSVHDKDKGNPVFVWALTKKGVRAVKNRWPVLDWSDRHYDADDIDWVNFRFLDTKPSRFRRNWQFSHNLIVQAVIQSFVGDMSNHTYGVTNMIFPRMKSDATLGNTNLNMKDIGGRTVWPDGFILNENGKALFIEVERHRKSFFETRDFLKKCEALSIFHSVIVVATTSQRKTALIKARDQLITTGILERKSLNEIKIVCIDENDKFPNALVLPGSGFSVRNALKKTALFNQIELQIEKRIKNTDDPAIQMLIQMEVLDKLASLKKS